MNTTQTSPFSLSINSETLRRLGVSADQISRLYYEKPAFRTLWDDYAVCLEGLQYWTNSPLPDAKVRALEYVQTLSDLEWKVRKDLQTAWDVIQDVVGAAIFGCASDVLAELRECYGMRGREIYLAALFPLIEIAWIGQSPTREARHFILSSGQYVCKRMSRLAGGIEVLSEQHLSRFMASYLECSAEPAHLHQLSNLGLAYLLNHSNPDLVKAREKAVWRCCYQIACSNPSYAPNEQQWGRLLDFLPEGIDWSDFQVLAKTEIPDLIANLKHAWQRDCIKDFPISAL